MTKLLREKMKNNLENREINMLTYDGISILSLGNLTRSHRGQKNRLTLIFRRSE
jgi:hypothetical protein